jgi:CubicO group peptidase (beta-lactamase class C family)
MKYYFTFSLLLSFLFSFSQNTYRQPHFADTGRTQKIKATADVIGKLYADHANNNHFPGFVYAVVADGQVAFSGSMGFTDIETKQPATTTSAFRIASMSKSFTAVAILQLRDKGKLRLDDAAADYIPEMKSIAYLTTDAPTITIRHLLTHASGFPEDNPWGDRQLDDTDKELLALVHNVSFSNVPGVAYEYSNLGFALLGQVVTNVSGMPYQQYITKNIFLPLGMKNTFWEYTQVAPKQLAHGYSWSDGQWKEVPLLHDGSFGAMGGIITTIEDFTKYMNFHLTAWPPRNGAESPVLKRSSLREMQAAHNFSGLNTRFKYASGRPCANTSAYAYGLRWSTDCDGKTFVGHSGGLPGFGSNWNILPEYGLGVVCFANVTYAPTGNFNLSILDTIVQLADLKPRVLPPSKILEQRQNELVQLLPNWKAAQRSGLFAENFFLDYDIASLQKQTSALFERAGKIIRTHPLKAENQLRGSFVLEGTNSNILVRFTLTPEKKPLIQEFHIQPADK